MIQDIFPHKLNNQFRPGQAAENKDFFLHYDGEKVLCRADGERIALPRVGDMLRQQQSLYPVLPRKRHALRGEFREGEFSERSTTRCASSDVGDWEMRISASSQSSDPARTAGDAGLPNRALHPELSVPAAKRLIYLFDLDGERFFLCPDEAVDVPDGYDYVPVRSFRRKDTDQKALIFALVTARHLNDWYCRSRYCGGCGQLMEPSKTERAMVCPSCGRIFYPRINPAVIVGVTNGDSLLLTKYAGRVTTHYALVAGFTEIGETFEETVAREVMEETGLEVTNIRYYKSQPWGFADDILTGYYCDVVGSPEIHLDRNELKMAVWVPREEITGQPDDFSLTNEMMIAFRDGRV